MVLTAKPACELRQSRPETQRRVSSELWEKVHLCSKYTVGQLRPYTNLFFSKVPVTTPAPVNTGSHGHGGTVLSGELLIARMFQDGCVQMASTRWP